MDRAARYRRARSLILAVVVLGGLAGKADTVRLRNGETLEGKAQELTNGSVRLELAGGGTVTLTRDQYTAVEYGPTSKEVYEERRSALSPRDATGHYRLALWCEAKGLTAEAKREFQAVLAARPDHEGAREALGYRRVDGVWLSPEEYHTRRGEVYFEGRWIKKETMEKRLRDRAAKQQRTHLRRLVAQAAGTGESAAKAIEELGTVSEADLVGALVDGLSRSTRTRLFAARELGALTVKGKTKMAVVKALSRLVVTGGSSRLREAGMNALKAINWSETPLLFCREVYHTDALHRIYALQALIDFPDPRCVRYVLESFPLVWKGEGRPGPIMGGVSAAYLKGFELYSGGTGRNVVEIAKPVVGRIAVGTGAAPGSTNSLDRRRRAEGYLRVFLLERLTGELLGANYAGWTRWWHLEGRAKFGAGAQPKPKKKEAPKKPPEKQGPPPLLPD